MNYQELKQLFLENINIKEKYLLKGEDKYSKMRRELLSELCREEGIEEHPELKEASRLSMDYTFSDLEGMSQPLLNNHIKMQRRINRYKEQVSDELPINRTTFPPKHSDDIREVTIGIIENKLQVPEGALKSNKRKRRYVIGRILYSKTMMMVKKSNKVDLTLTYIAEGIGRNYSTVLHQSKMADSGMYDDLIDLKGESETLLQELSYYIDRSGVMKNFDEAPQL